MLFYRRGGGIQGPHVCIRSVLVQSLLRVLVQEAAHFSVILVHVAVCQRYFDRVLDGETPASLPSTRPRVTFSSLVRRTTAKGYWKGSERAYIRRGVGMHVAALDVGLGHSSINADT